MKPNTSVFTSDNVPALYTFLKTFTSITDAKFANSLFCCESVKAAAVIGNINLPAGTSSTPFILNAAVVLCQSSESKLSVNILIESESLAADLILCRTNTQPISCPE